MPVATYTTINGMLVHENRGGVESFYFPDTLGNLTTVRSATGVKTYGAEYWPYGEIQTETGTNPSPWSFVGLLGYLRDTASRLYVRARHYRPGLARWQTVDPLWPDESAYGYVNEAPTLYGDPSGTQVKKPIDPCWACPDCDKCMNNAKEDAKRKLRNIDIIDRGIHGSRNNAIGHCTVACIIARTCPLCSVEWNCREWPADFGHGESARDLHNNNVGIGLSKKPGQCADLCKASTALKPPK